MMLGTTNGGHTRQTSFGENTHRKLRKLLLRITQVLICVVVLQSIKLVLVPNSSSAMLFSQKWHLLNMGIHTLFFSYEIVLLTHKKTNIAKYLLLFSFFSYISIAAYLWQVNVHLQFYFLLSMFICCYMFDRSEQGILCFFILLQVFLFLLLQHSLLPIEKTTTLSSIADKQFLQNILTINTIVFALSCVICALFIRHILAANWQELQQLKKTQEALLSKLFPSQLMPGLLKIDLKLDKHETHMQNTDYLGVVFVDICDFSSLSQSISLKSTSHKSTSLKSTFANSSHGESTYAESEQDIDSTQIHLDWQTTYKLFQLFDESVATLHAKRIKTNGDQYILLVGGINNEFTQSYIQTKSSIAKQTVEACKTLREKSFVNIKIGAAFGPVTYGIFDENCPNFDIWGETVIRAARLEAYAKSNEICIDEALKQVGKVTCSKAVCEVELKGIGKKDVFYV